MPNKRPIAPHEEISWRTEELGPEMRRRLFEKVLPSANPGPRRGDTAPAAKDARLQEPVKEGQRGKPPKRGRK